MSSKPQIQVKYFGMIAETTGHDQESMELESGQSLIRLNDELIRRYPALAQLDYRISVNQRFSRGDEVLQNGDEVALLPPFAGG